MPTKYVKQIHCTIEAFLITCPYLHLGLALVGMAKRAGVITVDIASRAKINVLINSSWLFHPTIFKEYNLRKKEPKKALW